MVNKKQVTATLPYFIAAGALTAGIVAWFKSRTGIPKGAKAVSPFNVEKYLGKWYEIARLDYHFEKNLVNVTAEYSRNDDGTIEVANRGQDSLTGEWEGSVGKAKFMGDKKEGRLKVSFFGPFYAAYNVIGIDKQYQNALVAGNDRDYLWLLSRKPEMSEKMKNRFLNKAEALGFDTSKLIWTAQQDSV